MFSFNENARMLNENFNVQLNENARNAVRRWKRFFHGVKFSTAVETCYENLENREKLHVPYGPLYP